MWVDIWIKRFFIYQFLWKFTMTKKLPFRVCIVRLVFHDRTNHFELNKHLIKEELENDLICVPYLPFLGCKFVIQLPFLSEDYKETIRVFSSQAGNGRHIQCGLRRVLRMRIFGTTKGDQARMIDIRLNCVLRAWAFRIESWNWYNQQAQPSLGPGFFEPGAGHMRTDCAESSENRVGHFGIENMP